MNWEQKIDALVRIAKEVDVYLDAEIQAPRSDYTHDVRMRLIEMCEEFCQWRHDEPYVVDEIKGLLDQQRELLHDYKVFCNQPFEHVGDIMGDNYLGTWKQDRDNLKSRANRLLGE